MAEISFGSDTSPRFQVAPLAPPRKNGRKGKRKYRRDPAPSRIAYRIQRLWLTPFVRKFVALGVPVIVAGLAAGWFLSSADRREATLQWITDVRGDFEQHPMFMVHMMAIDGVSEELAAKIRETASVDFPQSSFDLDLNAMHQRIAEMDAVKDVTIQVRKGGVLHVGVTERVPAIVWRGRGEVTLLDASGVRVSKVPARASRPDLPLVVGVGADKAIPEAVEIFQAAGPILDRMRGLVRMGERRWDIVLDRDQRILLPESDPIAALNRVIALDGLQDMLERDITTVDMRLSQRPTLRMAPKAGLVTDVKLEDGDGGS
ncbi:cell division protein FtsQ/DivIB [Halocynthiibacter sp. C4]|uniref:cell division protein FtsQ/DivIB n=1 Tax=Halocynthiibacter sp. C4 TaxID=2992758 RepID=UPI00237AAED4|nr:cell division protein FtsQ/DivIB [Halocynthiibacter sp. C4]MDE0589209.1 cell division protein FtsQ/DivIB [Halocynthiibacter sp. C4]